MIRMDKAACFFVTEKSILQGFIRSDIVSCMKYLEAELWQ